MSHALLRICKQCTAEKPTHYAGRNFLCYSCRNPRESFDRPSEPSSNWKVKQFPVEIPEESPHKPSVERTEVSIEDLFRCDTSSPIVEDKPLETPPHENPIPCSETKTCDSVEPKLMGNPVVAYTVTTGYKVIDNKDGTHTILFNLVSPISVVPR